MNNKSFKTIETFCKNNSKEILDIIIFGSTIRGKKTPKDLDIIILYRNKEDEELSYKLKKILEKENVTTDITSKTYKGLFDNNFIAKEAILKEGYSIINKELLCKKLNYSSYILFKYNLNKLSKSKKISFYYSLYGRNGNKGMISKKGLIKFSESTILCPIDKSEETKEYLTQQKIEYTETPILIPTRMY